MQDTLVSTPARAAPEPDELFTSLIDSRRDRHPFWRPWVIVAAVGLHVAVLAALLVRHWFEVPTIGAPPLQVEFTHFAPPAPPSAIR